MFHKHKFSRVFTVNGKSYQVCLTCAGEFLYDLKAMKRTQELKPKKGKLQIVGRKLA